MNVFVIFIGVVTTLLKFIYETCVGDDSVLMCKMTISLGVTMTGADLRDYLSD